MGERTRSNASSRRRALRAGSALLVALLLLAMVAPLLRPFGDGVLVQSMSGIAATIGIAVALAIGWALPVAILGWATGRLAGRRAGAQFAAACSLFVASIIGAWLAVPAVELAIGGPLPLPQSRLEWMQVIVASVGGVFLAVGGMLLHELVRSAVAGGDGVEWRPVAALLAAMTLGGALVELQLNVLHDPFRVSLGQLHDRCGTLACLDVQPLAFAVPVAFGAAIVVSLALVAWGLAPDVPNPRRALRRRRLRAV